MASDKRLRSSERSAFLRQCVRPKGRHGMDPNDRSYSREIEKAIKRMPPEELDRLIREEGDDA